MATAITGKRARKLPKKADFGKLKFYDREYTFCRREGRFLLRCPESNRRGIKIYLRVSKLPNKRYDWTPVEMYRYREGGWHNISNIGPFYRPLPVNRETADHLTEAIGRYARLINT